ncbi:hypothetical protein TcG_09799 [Trypanosoma cruzi]|nr:hypothetical protein TcG_09799 [Trypanosoma cruzi]
MYKLRLTIIAVKLKNDGVGQIRRHCLQLRRWLLFTQHGEKLFLIVLTIVSIAARTSPANETRIRAAIRTRGPSFTEPTITPRSLSASRRSARCSVDPMTRHEGKNALFGAQPDKFSDDSSSISFSSCRAVHELSPW